MREILFRGKQIDDGEWVEGSLIYDIEQDEAYIAESFEAKSAYIRQVDPETVGQYTGLKDKNEVKIFEGDLVVSRFTKKPYLVCFGEYAYTNEYGDDEDCCGWYNKEEDGYVTALGCPDVWAIVIGNIHDNPELLKEGGGE